MSWLPLMAKLRSVCEASTEYSVLPSMLRLVTVEPPSVVRLTLCSRSPVSRLTTARSLPVATKAMPSRTCTAFTGTPKATVCINTGAAGLLMSTRLRPASPPATAATPRTPSTAMSTLLPGRLISASTAGLVKLVTSTTDRPRLPVAT